MQIVMCYRDGDCDVSLPVNYGSCEYAGQEFQRAAMTAFYEGHRMSFADHDLDPTHFIVEAGVGQEPVYSPPLFLTLDNWFNRDTDI